MHVFAKLIAPLALAALPACAPQVATAPPPPSAASVQEQRTPVTILVSIDGFRADYLQRGLTPTLSKLAADGVSAAMIPSFPSKTFPNHWAEVTGYYPDHSGIVSNSFFDPARPEDKFTMATLDPFFWSDKEPIWVTAEKAHIRTSAMFWPGSSVAWGGELAENGYGRTEGGQRPEDWQAFDQNVSPQQRVNAVLDWLRRPAEIRPKFVLLYFDQVDTAGHEGGPNGSEIAPALRSVDADIAMLLDGLEALGQPVNLIVTADHGMAETRGSRTVVLDNILPASDYTLIESGPFASLAPAPGGEKALEATLLKSHPHMQCWRKGDIPARYHYGTNPRIPPYFCLAETGWQIFPHASRDDRVGGNHGYDNLAPEMRALFIANGPAFERGLTLPAFENVAVTPLIRHLLGFPQDAAMDGRLDPLKDALAG